MYTIYFDSIQEGAWFQNLHRDLRESELAPFPSPKELVNYHPELQNALSLDRPDIILCDDGVPILVVERTIEVPSGHNVGQRFARLVAAARHRIPVVYFGPYKAYKHGGATQGPRYMNLRLIYALDNMRDIYQTPVTTINWIVDDDCEIIRDESKDTRMKEYLSLFLELYKTGSFEALRRQIIASEFEKEQHKERGEFIDADVRNPEQYEGPPNSVAILNYRDMLATHPALADCELIDRESVLYNVGMRYVRSDPYTGMSLLYTYLYCGGLEDKQRNMVLNFSNLPKELWDAVAAKDTRKDVRLYKMVADCIIFPDGAADTSGF